MYLLIVATLVTTMNPGQQGPWPDEHPPLDRAAIQASIFIGGDVQVYRSPSLSLNFNDGTQWENVVDQAWSCLPPVNVQQSLRRADIPVWKSGVVFGRTGFHVWRAYETGTGGPGKRALHVYLWGCPDPEAASAALSNSGKGAAGAGPRVPVPGLDIGDQVHRVEGGPGSTLEFRLGRFYARVIVYGMGTATGDLIVEESARALEFRIWASGLMGDRSREFVLSNGVKLKGLATTNGYVPISEVARLGATVDSVDDPQRRRATMVRGATTVRADEYVRELRVNGRSVVAPPPIPYKGDLWVPIRAVVEALGYTITG